MFTCKLARRMPAGHVHYKYRVLPKDLRDLVGVASGDCAGNGRHYTKIGGSQGI